MHKEVGLKKSTYTVVRVVRYVWSSCRRYVRYVCSREIRDIVAYHTVT